MSEFLSNLSESLAAMVTVVDSGVVRVEGRRRLPASGIVWSSDGLIVTAHHTIESEGTIQVGLTGEKSVSATLVGRDPTTDVAVLRAESAQLSQPSWADPDSLRVGHLVLAVGRPGKSVRATLGIVSAFGPNWNTPAGATLEHYLQTDVAMYPGFSGGPLVDVSGKVLGMNSSQLLRGVSVAVTTPSLGRIVEALLAHGRIRRGYLGVGVQPVRLPDSLSQQAGQEAGLLIVSVESGSPADKSGILIGDTIVALDGQSVQRMDELLSFLSGDRIGSRTPVRVVRGGQLQDVSVVIGERA